MIHFLSPRPPGAGVAVLGRLLRLSVCLLFLLAWAGPASAHGPVQPQPIEWLPGQLLVKARAGEAGAWEAETIDALEAESAVTEATTLFPHYGSRALEERARKGLVVSNAMADLGRWILVETDATADPAKLARRLAELPEIEVAEPDYLMRLVEGTAAGGPPSMASAELPPRPPSRFLPNDPDFGLQWGLTFIDAPTAWDITQGDPSQVIAIIDTGVDLDHPDLASKIWSNAGELAGDANSDGCPGICGVDDDGDGLIDEDRAGIQQGEPGWDAAYADDDDENGYVDDFVGWDWISLGEGFEDNDPQDDNGHGTHCAGIAAAATDNGIGGAGACPDCTVMPLKAFQSTGTGAFSDIAKAIEYAWRNGATVISMSFSSSADSSLVRDALSLAFSSASLVAAAGNDSLSRLTPACSVLPQPNYPAHYSFVLGVEAGDSAGDRAGFSNCQYELRNPGVGIYSTVLDDAYATWSGTSMATPHVAGTAGLLRAVHAGDPAWTPDLVFGQLLQAGGNAFDALTLMPEPDLLFISFDIVDDCPGCDNDGRPDNGETVKVAVTVRNLWGNATAVSGTFTTMDALATVTDDTATWGSIGPSSFDDNSDNPFVVDIDVSAGNNHDIVFDLAIDAGNGGSGIATQIALTVQRGLEKGGIMASDETWTNENLYLVSDSLLVAPGVTLTIEPGTRVQVGANEGIIVDGELVARGTASERITLTGDGGDWSGINLQDATPAVLDEFDNYVSGTILEYCEYSNSVNQLEPHGSMISKCIYSDNDALMRISDGSRAEFNLITGNENDGLAVYCSSEAVGNTIVGNGVDGLTLFCSSQGATSVRNNNLFENQSYSFVAGPNAAADAASNYWGTTDTSIIDESIYDLFDDINLGAVIYEPILTAPDPDAPIVVADITLDPPSPVGAETVTFTITFSRPVISTLVDPEVFFGPTPPYASHPVNLNGSWLNDTTWEGQAAITVFTGDGLQKMAVFGVEDLDGFPLPFGDHRLGFEIVTSGTSAAQLSAVGDVGHIDLSWFPSALPDVAGYNLYRGESSGGPYTKLNSAVVVDTSYADHTALPGVPYFYIYRVVTTDLLEGPDSDEASASALDTVRSSTAR